MLADAAVGEEVDELAAVGGVAVPLVDVVGRAVAGKDAGQVGDRPGDVLVERREDDGADHHRVADQLPDGVVVGEAVLEELHLRVAGDGPGGVAGRAEVGGRDLLAAVAAQVEHGQVGEPAELQVAVDLHAVAGDSRAGEPDGHPLVVGGARDGLAGGPVALVGLVVLGAAGPGVVRGLVVVPGGDPRDGSVEGLQVGVGLVLRVALPVVGQAHHLVARLVGADDAVRLAVGVLPRAVLVDVVAHVQHRVEVAAGGEVAVGREVPGLPVGARDQGEAEPVGRGGGRRRGACEPDRGARAVEGEAVPVVRRRDQPLGVDLDGVVAVRAGHRRAVRDDPAEVGVGGHLPADAHPRTGARARQGVGGGGHPGPQHDGARQRVTGRDPVAEGGRGGGSGREVGRRGSCGPGQGGAHTERAGGRG